MKIVIAGDFCPQERVAAAFNRGDYQAVLGEIRPLLEESDFSMVNFECPVTKGCEKPISKLGLNLQCSEKGIEAVKWVGFDCVTLANNHFYDFGEEGVANTLEACRKHELSMVGGGTNITEAAKILYKQIDGQTLAVINCCEHEFSIATEKTGGSNPLNPIQQYYAIQEARDNADFVLIVVHGGHEYFQLPSPRMVETYRFFIDAGADAVVNHHQHCYSGYEFYQGKPIFYGLGNFCFDEVNDLGRIWNEGYLLKLCFSEESIGFEIFPYEQCAEKPILKLLPQDVFQENVQHLNTIITSSEKLQLETSKYYKESMRGIHNILNPTRNRFLFALQNRGYLPSPQKKPWLLKMQNYILCESHRDKMKYYFFNKQPIC